MPHVSFTELRSNMARHLDQVLDDRAELVVTRQNREPVVILPLAELEGIRETLHLLGARENAEQLLGAVAELDADHGIERDLLDP